MKNLKNLMFISFLDVYPKYGKQLPYINQLYFLFLSNHQLIFLLTKTKSKEYVLNYYLIYFNLKIQV